MKLASDIAELLSDAYVEAEDGWSWVATEAGDSGRWRRQVTTIVRGPDGNTYGYDWDEALTEMQDGEYPWEDGDEIDVYAVRPVIVSTTTWVAVK